METISNYQIDNQFGFDYKGDKVVVSKDFVHTHGYHETYITIYKNGDYNDRLTEYCGSFVSGDRKEELEVIKARLKNIYPDMVFTESKSSYFMSYSQFKQQFKH